MWLLLFDVPLCTSSINYFSLLVMWRFIYSPEKKKNKSLRARKKKQSIPMALKCFHFARKSFAILWCDLRTVFKVKTVSNKSHLCKFPSRFFPLQIFKIHSWKIVGREHETSKKKFECNLSVWRIFRTTIGCVVHYEFHC